MKCIGWKDIWLHYGPVLIGGGLAVLAEWGVQIPGVSVDPKVAGAAALAALVAGFKGGTTSGGK